MIIRQAESRIRDLMAQFPVVAILGPRQVGKTTLAHQIATSIEPAPVYLDLESSADLARLSEPESYFERHRDNLVILDEVHRVPQIFTTIRGAVDRGRRLGRKSCQFLILGSASLDLLRQSSETLAGRVAFHSLSGFNPIEIPARQVDRLWLRGGFPDSFLAKSDTGSFDWRQAFIRTYLERDIPQFGVSVPASTLNRFWTMLAHVQSGLINFSRIASGLSISVPTVIRYVDLLEDLLLVRRLQPRTSNVGKRMVKAPKVYIRDSGIVHALLRIKDQEDLLGHPVVGGSWEGFVIESLLSDMPDGVNTGFYRTAAGAEVDLVLDFGRKTRVAIEIKRTLSPAAGKGFAFACKDLKATHRYFVYPGNEVFEIGEKIVVMPLADMTMELKRFSGTLG